MDKFSFLEQYEGINPKVVAENYDRAYKLYEGNWVKFGDYLEDGDFITNNKDRDRAIEEIGLLYHNLEPYNQQIREDYQKYRQMDWLEICNLPYGEGEILERLYWVCEFYDTHIRFIEELRAKYQPQQPTAPAVGKPQQMEEKKALNVILTAKVKGCFDKAIERGWMEETSNGYYEWMGLNGAKKRGHIQQLAFFCGYIYKVGDWSKGVGGANMPTKELEQIFGVKGLSKRLNKFKKDWLPKWSGPIIELVNSVKAS